MYIAFRWLLGLNMAMWFAMCCIDIVFRKNRPFKIVPDCGKLNNGFLPMRKQFYDPDITEAGYKNLSGPILIKHMKEDLNLGDSGTSILALMHYIAFFAGIITVTIFNRKKEILSHTKTVIMTSKSYLMEVYRKKTKDINVNDSLINIRIGAINHLNTFLTYAKSLFSKFKSILKTLKVEKNKTQRSLNLVLVKKLKKVLEERKFLGQLLLAAIYENKNIRTQCQLENMAKNRLVRHVDDTKKLIKENRSKYISFQQLYWVTHKENIFLKARLVKVTKEKEDAERNLLGLVNEVYRSKNKDLKAYCTRFVVNTENNLLCLDPKTEIKKFLQKSIQPSSSVATWRSHLTSDIENDPPRCFLNSPPLRHILNEHSGLVPFLSEPPKLRGLPGEYVWTVKDKEGIIEKLYECAYESDNGDIVQKIREYSVYYDKECLLDFNDSKTVINEINNDTDLIRRQFNVAFPIASSRFLTGSEAFQKFMTRIRNVISFSSSPATPITYE